MVKKLIFWFTLIDLILAALIFGPGKTQVSEAKQIYDRCSNLLYKESCYADEFYKFTRAANLQASVKVLSELQEIDPKNSIGCHFIAHRISVAETEKNPDNWEEVLKKIRPHTCSGGFIHGVVEARFHEDPTFKINAESVDLICKKTLNDKSFGEQSCNHIMGHLLMVENGGIIDRSVRECRELNKDAQFECLSGVFMENLTREGLVQHGLAKHINWTEKTALEIEKLCGQYSQEAEQACWREISYIYAAINNYSAEGIFRSCQKAPNENSKTSCFIYGIGNAVNFPGFDEGRITSSCSVYSKADPKFQFCNFQIIGSMIASSEKNVDRALLLCESMEGESEVVCYSYLLETMKIDGIDKNVILKSCAKMPLSFPGGKCI